MLSDKKVKEIIKFYNESGNIYQAAKLSKTSYNTAKRILINNNIILNNINNNIPEVIEIEPEISTNTSLPASQQDINNIYKYNNNINNKDINIKDNNKYNDINEVSIKDDSLHDYKIDTKKAKYIDQLDKSLNNLFRRYKNDYKLVHPNFLSRDIGIMIDKINVLTGGNNTNIDNRSIIFANFGHNEDMISAITQIKTNKNKLVNR